MNEFSSNFSSSLIRSGYRRPVSTVTAKTSCTAVSNRKSAITCPVVRSITQTPQVRSLSVSRSVIGMPLKTALSRTCDNPTNARLPANSSPRVNPGISAIGTYLRVFGSMNPIVPAPDSQTQSRPTYHRGEWGIDNPRVITAPEATSIMMPPRALSARQPAASSVAPSAVT